MYRPPENIRYEPDPGRWPTAEEASQSVLFSPVRIGPLTLDSRTWIPAMVPWRATEEGMVTDEVLNWYERFAKGRPGAIVVEATGIRDIPSGPLLRIGHDRFLPGLKRLVDTVRRASDGHTKLFIQCIDFLAIRRRPKKEKFFERYLNITDAYRAALDMRSEPEAAVRSTLAGMDDRELAQFLDERDYESYAMGYRERITDMHLDHIRALPEILPGLFADAAERAKRAGFDGVELHYAHAYTMASFLSARNSRDDGYGGSRAARVRLPVEVFEAVRGRVGPDYAVGCRYLSEDCIDGGHTVEDAAYYGVEFARAGMDFLSTSRGGKFEDAKQPKVGWAAYPYTGRSGWECMPTFIADKAGPFGRNVEPTGQIRAAVRDAGFEIPVVVTGGIHGYEQAEKILREGKADIIGAARQSLADPDWFRKAKLGHGNQVRVCEYTNYCEGLDQKHKMVTCKLWDRANLTDKEIKLTDDGKRRQVAPAWSPGNRNT